MFQFPGSPRAFRDRRSLGSSPGLFAAFHARILMTPRHPPRALRSLTTPTRPPRRPAREPPAADGRRRHVPDLPSVPRPAASRDAAGRLTSGNDPLCGPRPPRVERTARRIRKGPLFVERLIDLPLPRMTRRDSTDACVTNHRIVREQRGAIAPPAPGCASTRGRGRRRTAPPRGQRARGEQGQTRANRREAARPVESRSIALGSGSDRQRIVLRADPRGEPA